MKYLRKYNEINKYIISEGKINDDFLKENQEIFEDLIDSFIDLIDLDTSFEKNEHLIFHHRGNESLPFKKIENLKINKITLYIGTKPVFFDDFSESEEDLILDKKIEYYKDLSNFLSEVKFSINKFISINDRFEYRVNYMDLIKRDYVTIIFFQK
jgi:hypothetical protein